MAEVDYDELGKERDDDSDTMKSLRAALRAKNKTEKELRGELTSERTSNRTRSLADLLKSSGVNEKVAKLLPADIEASETAVKAWLDEFSDVLGIKQEPGTEAPDDEQEAQRALARATDSFSIPNVGLEAAQAQLRAAKTPEERALILKNATGT